MTVKDYFTSLDYAPAPESGSTASAWLDAHGRKFGLYIGGKWHAPQSGNYFETINPANGQKIADIADANASDVDAAVKAARAAFAGWSALSGHARARYLYAIAREVQKHSRLFAVLESLDNGKSIRESRDIDIPLVARHFYHNAGWAQLMATELRDYQPVGVVGQVIPWNFPLLMLAWKIAPALAMGNTLVLKPAPHTPLTAILFAEICAEAGLPAGVVNIVTGGDEAGASITSHPDFDKIAFTGSTGVGRIIRRVTAGTGKKLSLELGGKSPFIVFEDADLDSAVEGLVDAIWFNQGQVCCAGSRLLVQESVAPRLLTKLKRRMSSLRVGDSLDKTVDMGPVVAPVQYETIDKLVKLGLAEGAELFQADTGLPTGGCYYPPTLLTNVQPASTVAQEEIFGPVLVAMTFRTPAEAIELGNNTRFGLAASIWSENINLAMEAARKIKAGSVWVNCTNLFDAASGFGGYRESGFGREGGKEGLYEYVRAKGESRPRPDLPAKDDPAYKAWGKAKPALPGGAGVLSAESEVMSDSTDGAPSDGSNSSLSTEHSSLPTLDRTAKLFIGGKQKRPDGAYSKPVLSHDGKRVLGLIGDGNRKDIRDAVSAARSAENGWAYRTGHNRAQILYFIAENLSARADEFARRIDAMTGVGAEAARREVELSIERLFTYAAYADKYGGTVQETELRGLTIALTEPIGVVGVVCPDEQPLLAMISLLAPVIARGNSAVVIPSEKYPLVATDFYQVLETSDVPGGVVNIVTGERDVLTKTLVEHDDVDAVWYFGSALGSHFVESLSAANMKRTWVGYGVPRDWADDHHGAGEEFLREATHVKNIWVPMGE
ncbi:MAG: aldehyde dehydrogenase family protein [Anaerolineae bacterium]|jgi:aldehyde dehydrogenase (NAD+)|nr:aldehyde dehydrogenase family protein [Anaerolineae bacterium]